MAVVEQLLRAESDGTISFGNYELTDKTKKDGFEYNGDSYKIKTFNEITKLERNGMFVYESVPGTAVHEFRANDTKVMFSVESPADAQVTLELEPETEYKVHVDDVYVGKMKTNLGGKLSISVETEEAESVAVVVEKAE